MIFFLSDFGPGGQYQGQMESVVAELAPRANRLSLFSDLPMFKPELAAYLLPAYTFNQIKGSIFVCVVDPGVGTERKAIAIEADSRWYIGPDNGLFTLIIRRSNKCNFWDISNLRPNPSATFHGRDLFAPAAAKIFNNDLPIGKLIKPSTIGNLWPDDLNKIIYIDHYGNLITGLRAVSLLPKSIIKISKKQIMCARTFEDVKYGEPFWYVNSNGLIEIAVNSRSAEIYFEAQIGDSIEVLR